MRSAALALSAVLVLAPGLPAQDVQEPDSAAGPIIVHPEADRAIAQLKSPFCPGLMLEVCPSPNAKTLRDSLAILADQGISSDSLVAMVLARYGEEWRALPKRSGMGLLAWVLPPLVLLVGMGVVLELLRRRSRARVGEPGDAAPELSDEDRARLERALREFEESEETVF